MFIAYLLLGVTWILAHALGLLGPLSAYTFTLVGVLSIAATVVGLRRNRPTPLWPWVLILGALLLFAVGGALREAMGTFADLSAERSLVPDLVTLPGYLVVGFGLTRLARARSAKADLDAQIDGLVAALAALVLAWVYLVSPALEQTQAPLELRIVLACYPPASVFLVAVAFHLAYGRGRAAASVSSRLLLASLTSMLLGDVLYMLADAHIASIGKSLLDAPYALAFLLFGAAVLHPSVHKITEAAGSTDDNPSRSRLAIVAAGLTLPAVVTATRSEETLYDRTVLAVLILALTGLAVWRMFRALAAQSRAQNRLAHQATHDSLTGLPNRAYMGSFLDGAIASAASAGEPLGVIFLDLDRFKNVNDTLGHAAGDALLVAVAERLQASVPAGALVARLGGDEFVVALPGADVSSAQRVAEELRLGFQVPFLVSGTEVTTTTTLGVSVFAGGEVVPGETLVRDADTALYQAKDDGRDLVAVFDEAMRQRSVERIKMEAELRYALERGQLTVAFQPLVRCGDGTVRGLEALLRWNHPVLGNVSPAAFIPVAEESGLIVEIGRWVLVESCRQVAAWRSLLGADLEVAVNVSARQLAEPGFVTDVAAALARSGLPAAALDLELTESLLVSGVGSVSSTLQDLRGLGVSLSVDDFGTGYSSLAYLKRFPVTRVKVDRSFVAGVADATSSDQTLVAAIVAMARALGMDTVAEGVETPEQAERISRLGCTYAQGYLYSRPLPVEEVPSRLRELGFSAAALP